MKREVLDEISFQIDIAFITLFLTTFFVGRISGLVRVARAVFREDQGLSTPDFLMFAFRSDIMSMSALAAVLVVIFAPSLRRAKSVPVQSLLGIEASGRVYVTEGGFSHASERSDLYRRIVALPSSAKNSRGITRSHNQCRIAHELAHTSYRDYLTLRIYMAASAISAFSIGIYLFQVTFVGDEPRFYFNGSSTPIVQRDLLVRVLIPLLTLYRTASFLWRREFRADRRAAEVVGEHKYLKYLQFCANKERFHVSNNRVTYLLQRLLHPTFSRRRSELVVSSSNISLISDATFFGCLSAVVGGSFFSRFPPLYRNPRSCGFEEADLAGAFFGASCGEMWASAIIVSLIVVVLAALITSISRVTLSRLVLFWTFASLAVLFVILVVRMPLLWEGDEELRELNQALALPLGKIAFLQNYGFVLLPTAGASAAVWLAARAFAQPILIAMVLLMAGFAMLAHSVYINPIAMAYDLGDEPTAIVRQTFEGGIALGFLNRWMIALTISMFASTFLTSKSSVAAFVNRK